MLWSSRAAGTSAENKETLVYSPLQPEGTKPHISHNRSDTQQQNVVQEVRRCDCLWERERQGKIVNGEKE